MPKLRKLGGRREASAGADGKTRGTHASSRKRIGNHAMGRLIEAGRLDVVQHGGKPLTSARRRRLEAEVSTDLDTVRIHEGALPLAFDAAALTRGEHIHVAPGHDTDRVIRHEIEHVLQQREQTVPATHTEHGVPVNADARLEAAAERPRRPRGRRPAARRTPDPRAPVQCLKLVEPDQEDHWTAVSDSDPGGVESDKVPLAKRAQVVADLIESGDDTSLDIIVDEWLARAPVIDAVLNASKALKELLARAPSSALESQRALNALIVETVRHTVGEVMAAVGLDPTAHAVVLLGSAARGEMFPGSDIDLFILGDEAVPKRIGDKIHEKLASVMSSVVHLAHQKVWKFAAEPLKLDAGLGGSLFHTPESALETSMSDTVSSDNMVMDMMLVNHPDGDALYDRFGGDYKAAIEEKLEASDTEHKRPEDTRSTFIAEHLVTMKDMLAEAVAEIRSGGDFNIKNGLMRIPSLIARDYYTWRHGFESQPMGTVDRLRALAKGDEETALPSETVEAVVEGFEYGTELRMSLEKAPKAGRKKAKALDSTEQHEVEQHLTAYMNLLYEVHERVRDLPPRRASAATDPTQKAQRALITEKWTKLDLQQGKDGLDALHSEYLDEEKAKKK